MSVLRFTFAALVLSGAALPARAGKPVEILNSGFDRIENGVAVGWGKYPNWTAERDGYNGSGCLTYESADGKPHMRPHQDVNVKTGRSYRFSALVRADGLKTERKTTSQGITVLVSWYDENGKWMGEAQTDRAVSGTSADWERIEGQTPEIPARAARVTVGAYVCGRCVGKARIDNVYMEAFEQEPVEGVFTDAYRREAADGTIRLAAVVNLADDVPPEEHVAAFTYVGTDGRPRRVRGRIENGGATAEVEVSRIAVGTHPVTCTLFAGRTRLGEASMAFTRLEKPRRRKVTFDRRGRTLVDGKPFFPFGMYTMRQNVTNIPVYAEGPFNCVLPYGHPTPEQMALYDRFGIKVIVHLLTHYDDKDFGEKWVRESMAKYKDCPNLLGWYPSDEQPLTEIPKMTLRHRWIEEIDPDHPALAVLPVVGDGRHYLATYDVLGMDKYPVSHKSVQEVIRATRGALANSFGTRPLWFVPQAFGWNWLGRREAANRRPPTVREMANMTWQAIAGGAQGIIYYSFHHLEEPHADPNDAFRPAWTRVKEAASEAARYLDVFLSDEPAPVVSGETEAIAARCWRTGDKTHFLVVNCTEAPQTADLTLSERFSAVAGHAFGPLPEFTDGNRFRARLGPLEYVMLELRR